MLHIYSTLEEKLHHFKKNLTHDQLTQFKYIEEDINKLQWENEDLIYENEDLTKEIYEQNEQITSEIEDY